MFQPRRLSYSRHAVDDKHIELGHPINYKVHMQVRRMVSENRLRRRKHHHHNNTANGPRVSVGSGFKIGDKLLFCAFGSTIWLCLTFFILINDSVLRLILKNGAQGEGRFKKVPMKCNVNIVPWWPPKRYWYHLKTNTDDSIICCPNKNVLLPIVSSASFLKLAINFLKLFFKTNI